MKKALEVLTLLAGAVSGYAQGQVYFGDYLKTDFQITVWSPQAYRTAGFGTEITGNSPAVFDTAAGGSPDIPSGTQTLYTGVPLGGSATGAVSQWDYANGNLWSVQLYAGPGVGDGVWTLVPVSGTVAHFFTDSAVEGYPGSWFSDVPATISTSTTGTTTLGGATVAPFGVAVGSQATLAIAAWYNGNGAYTSYAAAVAAGQPAGVSTTGSENLGGNQWVPPDLPAPGGGSHMVGFDADVSGGITSFSLSAGNSSLLSPVPEPGTMALGVIGAAAFLMRLRRK